MKDKDLKMKGLFTVRKEDWGYVLYNEAYDRIGRFLKSDYKGIDSSVALASYAQKTFYGTQNVAKEVDLSAPLSVSWMVTNACNSKCLHCRTNSGQPDRDELGLSDAYRLLEMLKDLGVLRLVISGGEPLVRKDIVKILKETNRLGLNVVLSTNGFLLNSLFEADVYPNFVEVSLDHTDEEKNDWFRGFKGYTSVLINNLKILKKKGIKFRVMTTLSRFNWEQIKELSDLVCSLGAVQHEYLSLIPTGRAVNWSGDYALSNEEYHLAREEIKKQADLYRGKLTFDCFNEGSNLDLNRCYFLIDPRGDVYTFDTEINNNVLVGNVMTNTLKALWNSKEFDRRAHLDYWTAVDFI